MENRRHIFVLLACCDVPLALLPRFVQNCEKHTGTLVSHLFIAAKSIDSFAQIKSIDNNLVVRFLLFTLPACDISSTFTVVCIRMCEFFLWFAHSVKIMIY